MTGQTETDCRSKSRRPRVGRLVVQITSPIAGTSERAREGGMDNRETDVRKGGKEMLTCSVVCRYAEGVTSMAADWGRFASWTTTAADRTANGRKYTTMT